MVFNLSAMVASNSTTLLQGGGIPAWVWVLIVVIVILLALWLMRRPAEGAPPAQMPPRMAEPPKAVEAPPAPMASEMAAPEMPAAPAVPEAPAVAAPAEAPMMAAPAAAPAMPAAEMPAAPAPDMAPAPEPDDLTKIEGIGPAISSALRSSGIFTFAQLAETDASRVRDILRDSSIRIGDPGTWAQQARLAAAGDWAKLKKLQDKLIGGRKA